MRIIETKKRWTSMMKRLVCDPSHEIFDELVKSYNEPHRKYHTLNHVNSMLNEFASVKKLSQNPNALEFAIWFHDAIYNPKGEDNELRSARLAAKSAKSIGLSDQFAAEVHHLIAATINKKMSQSNDVKILVDLDLSSFGSSPDIFDSNTKSVRLEYRWMSKDEFNCHKMRLFNLLLKRDPIFFTKAMRDKYEKRARLNLRRSLKNSTSSSN